MKALRLHADLVHPEGDSPLLPPQSFWKNARLAVEDLPVPQPGPEDLLLRVSYSGIGQDDLRFDGQDPSRFFVYNGRPQVPVTLGYEFSAVVAGYGNSVPAAVREAFPVGTAVTAEDRRNCGACAACRAGGHNDCEETAELGFTSDGAHAEYLAVPAQRCWSLAPMVERFGMDSALRLGALTHAYATAFRGFFGNGGETRWVPGGRVLVVGAGPIGLAALDLALAAGAAEVHSLEIDPGRRQTARELGATLALAPQDSETLTGPYDWIVDAAGAPEIIQFLLNRKAARGAFLALLAQGNATASLPIGSLLRKNLRVVATAETAGGYAYERVIRLFGAGRLQGSKMIRETLTLDQAAVWLANQKKCEGKAIVAHGTA